MVAGILAHREIGDTFEFERVVLAGPGYGSGVKGAFLYAARGAFGYWSDGPGEEAAHWPVMIASVITLLGGPVAEAIRTGKPLRNALSRDQRRDSPWRLRREAGEFGKRIDEQARRLDLDREGVARQGAGSASCPALCGDLLASGPD